MCQHFIGAGDIYQANLSHRFRVEGLMQGYTSQAEAGAVLYRQLRKVNPSPHSAFLVLESDVLVCNSPERLVRLSGRYADMRPIAGTRPRGTNSQDDRRMAEDLLSCPKERAEHLMLVDLARNDLGRVCDYGSVRVNELMTVERYSHVMHLVSHVSGRLRDACNGFDLIRATFPGGTITGVPKVHCMELIEQLEPVRRGIYTGSIGLIGWNGNLDLNIAIRTLLLRAEQGYLQVGRISASPLATGRETFACLVRSREAKTGSTATSICWSKCKTTDHSWTSWALNRSSRSFSNARLTF
jgi:anthranilate/para-aminobenzoate synthase component I